MPSLTFSFSMDREAAIFRVTNVGVWTLEDVRRYADEAPAEYAKARLVGGQLRMLIDNRRATLFSKEVIGPLGAVGTSLTRPGDRYAILVDSTLMKMQTKRVMPEGPTNVFVSESAALQWLTAYDAGSSPG